MESLQLRSGNKIIYSRLFFYLLLGFLSGILLHSFFVHPFTYISVGVHPISLLWLISGSLILGASIVFWRTPYFMAVFLIGAASLFGLYRFETALDKLNTSFTSGEIIFKANGEVRRYPKSYQFVGQNEVGRFWVITKIPIKVGDNIAGNCRFERVAKTDQYYGWYAAKEVGSVCFLNKGEVINSGQAFIKKLFEIKNVALQHINRLFDRGAGALLGGMLFGGTSGLSKEAADNFRSAGLTHLVAISGYNFSLLADFMLILFGWFYAPRRLAAPIVGLLLFIFFILVGPSASAARAVLMSSLVLMTKMLGRQKNMTRGFTVAAAILLAVNPLSLRYDAGFVLSFVATGTLIYAVPWLSEKLELFLRLKKMRARFLWWKVKNIIKNFFEIILASSLIMITTAPVLWWFFGRISFASVLSNTLVGPIVPLVMIGGYLFTIVSFIYLPLAGVFVWGLDLLLKYIMAVANFLA